MHVKVCHVFACIVEIPSEQAICAFLVNFLNQSSLCFSLAVLSLFFVLLAFLAFLLLLYFLIALLVFFY